ncbi:HpcH/HpaI aldolase/citrate lyase family protein [Sphingorhabdus arenilitoris]|uniref:HpcH/HpaI aldolase/citrate lyase family protein n=1 Tax=Sphingorhabdus arenilitoris TaxID=1490041 RepID=A0ABV8RJJ6_9SPHN
MTQISNPPPHRPRRSCLYMPASNERAMAKAASVDADVIILDLEDAVAPDAKDSARQAACDAISARKFGARETVIRINAPDSIWGQNDLRAAVASGVGAVLAPKVTSAADIAAIDSAMTAAGAASDLPLWVMIEMPAAILNITEIAAASRSSRLSAFVVGTNDLAKEMRATSVPGRAPFLTALHMTVMAARAFGLAAIDGVFNDIGDLDGLEAECAQGRMMGYDGKTAIHPAQLAHCNRIFSPEAEEVAQARAVIAAFADPANAGQAVIKVDGRMTELLHLEEAKRTVAIADSIAAAAN